MCTCAPGSTEWTPDVVEGLTQAAAVVVKITYGHGNKSEKKILPLRGGGSESWGADATVAKGVWNIVIRP